MRSRLLALPAALAVLLFAAGSALAWPPGSVTVDVSGCDYTLHIQGESPNVAIGWEVRVYTTAVVDGDLVASGTGATDAQGNWSSTLQTGVSGHYNLLMGYGLPVTGHFEVVEFTLSCETPTPTPSETATPTPSETVAPSETATATPSETATPTPTPSESVSPSESASATPTGTPTETPSATATETPTTTPSSTELPAEGTPTPPTGGVLGAVGGSGVTPPPTNTAPTAAVAPAGGTPIILAGIIGLIAGILVFTRMQAVRPGATRTRKDRS